MPKRPWKCKDFGRGSARAGGDSIKCPFDLKKVVFEPQGTSSRKRFD
ncbi:hypothetical protein HMPREF9440_00134, partial [Sutterella parvirubra YIT 11816]